MYNAFVRASGSGVEHRLAKARVAGPNPVSRFFAAFLQAGMASDRIQLSQNRLICSYVRMHFSAGGVTAKRSRAEVFSFI